MPEIPRQITTYEKAPSADVDKFLGALKKMPSSSKNMEKERARREIDVMDLFSPGPWECPKNYVHGKPFLPHVDLQLRPWELMQWLEEEKTHKHKVAYLDPARIHQTEHSFKMTEQVNEQLKAAKTKKQKAEIKEELHKKERHKVSVYIAKVMLKRVDKKYIFAPYGFDNHWIAILIMPKLGRAVVLNSADYDQKRYMEFIGILQK
ncbi:hypothetical protein C2845_PM18G11700 [Panicum miliaceum]|uniref:Ubiquitin-like protease family profile domain-containing protein n=1 Tax=Panicum miliaceum TaxID=4540 RepID=A0A3L6PMR9_PANMI|nr:hypothetical protein C2845_PM18G11700 [Panicum miliaceum]